MFDVWDALIVMGLAMLFGGLNGWLLCELYMDSKYRKRCDDSVVDLTPKGQR